MESREELRRKLRAKIAGKRGGETHDNAAEQLLLSVAEQHPELFGIAQQALQRPHAVQSILRQATKDVTKDVAKDVATTAIAEDDEEAPPPPS